MIKKLCLIVFIALSITPQKGFPKEDIAYSFQIAPQLPDGTYGDFGSEIYSHAYAIDIGRYPVILRVKNKNFQKDYHLFACDAECSDGVYIKVTNDENNEGFHKFVVSYENKTGVSFLQTKQYYSFNEKNKKIQHIKAAMVVQYFDEFIE